MYTCTFACVQCAIMVSLLLIHVVGVRLSWIWLSQLSCFVSSAGRAPSCRGFESHPGHRKSLGVLLCLHTRIHVYTHTPSLSPSLPNQIGGLKETILHCCAGNYASHISLLCVQGIPILSYRAKAVHFNKQQLDTVVQKTVLLLWFI